MSAKVSCFVSTKQGWILTSKSEETIENNCFAIIETFRRNVSIFFA
jgi:hypothetical protein